MANSSKETVQKAQGSKSQGNEGKKDTNGILFGLLAFLTAIIIIVGVFGGAFYIFIHNNINGLGEKYRQNIQAVPLLSWMLPSVSDPGDPKYLTPDEIKSRYVELRGANALLTKQLADANKQIKDLQSLKSDLDKANADNAQLKKDSADNESQIADREKKLADDKKAIDALVANGDTAGFKAYFESVDSANAQSLYQDIVKQQLASDDVKNLAQLYESMDPTAASKILEQMGNAKIDLIVSILKNMKKEISSQILAAMDPVFAGKLTEKLSELSSSAP